VPRHGDQDGVAKRYVDVVLGRHQAGVEEEGHPLPEDVGVGLLDPETVDPGRWIAEPDPITDVLSPARVAMAVEAVVDDARHFLNVNHQKYDYVVLDAFNGDSFPGHLLTREALSLVAAAMAPDGVLAMNLVAGLRPGDRIAPSVIRTLRTSFEQVEVRPLFDPSLHRFGNVEVVAYRGPPRALDGGRLNRLDVVPEARWAMPFLWRTVELALDDGVVLTDDFNPMEDWDLDVKEQLRQRLAANRAEWDLSAPSVL